jgi:hypothetical protein
MANQTNETKRVAAIEATIGRTPEGQAGSLALTFANGKKLILAANQLSDDIMAEALIHGLKQKLVDAAAISRNPTTGKSATVDDKYQAVKEVYDRLLSGAWNAERGEGQGTLLVQALCRMHGKDATVVREWLGKKSEDEVKALRVNPKVAAIIAQIQAERAKVENIDSDAMLNELS